MGNMMAHVPHDVPVEKDMIAETRKSTAGSTKAGSPLSAISITGGRTERKPYSVI